MDYELIIGIIGFYIVGIFMLLIVEMGFKDNKYCNWFSRRPIFALSIWLFVIVLIVITDREKRDK